MTRGPAAALALLLACLVSACGAGEPPPPEEETISRERFVSTYVALREAALQTDSAKIAAEDRERILAERDVSEEDLLTFVEVHGHRLAFMEEVWNDVQERLEGSEATDTARGEDAPDPEGEAPPPGRPDTTRRRGGPAST